MDKEFDINVWRSYYDEINILGQYLKYSYPDWDGNPPKFIISLSERRKVEKDIAEIIKKCSAYLNKFKDKIIIHLIRKNNRNIAR